MNANNTAHFVGRMCADPELKTTQSGVSVCAFSIAVSRAYVAKGEERKADFIDCVAWRSNAEFVCRYFSKGDVVVLLGEMQTRTYEDKNGNKRKAVELIVDSCSFGGNKAAEKQKPTANEKPQETYESGSYMMGDDDLTF